MDPLDQGADSSRGQYGVLKLQNSPRGNETTSENADNSEYLKSKKIFS